MCLAVSKDPNDASMMSQKRSQAIKALFGRFPGKLLTLDMTIQVLKKVLLRSARAKRMHSIRRGLQELCKSKGEEIIDVAFALVNSCLESRSDMETVQVLWRDCCAHAAAPSAAPAAPAPENELADAPEEVQQAVAVAASQGRSFLKPMTTLALKVGCRLSKERLRMITAFLRKEYTECFLSSEKHVQQQSHLLSPLSTTFTLLSLSNPTMKLIVRRASDLPLFDRWRPAIALQSIDTLDFGIGR